MDSPSSPRTRGPITTAVSWEGRSLVGVPKRKAAVYGSPRHVRNCALGGDDVERPSLNIDPPARLPRQRRRAFGRLPPGIARVRGLPKRIISGIHLPVVIPFAQYPWRKARN